MTINQSVNQQGVHTPPKKFNSQLKQPTVQGNGHVPPLRRPKDEMALLPDGGDVVLPQARRVQVPVAEVDEGEVAEDDLVGGQAAAAVDGDAPVAVVELVLDD